MEYNKVPIEPFFCSGSLKFLYNTVPGRVILKFLINPFVSKAVGAFMNTPFSKFMINRCVKKYNIDLSEYQKDSYRCYNDFFTRKIKPEKRPFGDGLVSPCDAKLTAYEIDDVSSFEIKGSRYRIEDILGDTGSAEFFKGGICLVFRLSVDNYHRYCYFDDCTELGHRYIKGKLHTVQPIAFLNNKVFYRNSRECTLLETEHFGKAAYVEVGALCVGKILNSHKPGKLYKGQEKGMFLFGGSTIVLLLRNVKISSEILENTENGYETVVKMGQKIGE